MWKEQFTSFLRLRPTHMWSVNAYLMYSWIFRGNLKGLPLPLGDRVVYSEFLSCCPITISFQKAFAITEGLSLHDSCCSILSWRTVTRKKREPGKWAKNCSYQQDKVCLHVFCWCLHTRYLCICNVSCKLSQIQLDPIFCLKCMLLKVYGGKSSKFGLFHWVLKS